MKFYRGVLCVLLALAMAFSFCACGGAGEEGPEVTSVPAETVGGESAASTQTDAGESAAPDESSDPSEDEGTTTLLDLTGSGPDCVVLSREEYENRPRGIQEGTVLDYIAPNEIYSLLPWNCASEGWLWGNVFEGLLYMHMNDPEDIRGCIAESWEHSKDYLIWTFKIRDGVRFTDGTACDAEAVSDAWEHIRYENPTAMSYNNIESWEAVSVDEFVVHLSAPCGWFEAALCGNALLTVSPTSLDVYGGQDERAAVGTGPYYIHDFSSGVSLIMKANAAYTFDAKMPCIETVTFLFIRDNEAVLEALLGGEADGANLSDVESYKTLEAGGFGGYLAACLGDVNPMWLNAKKVPAFEIFEVREALCRFIDFAAVNKFAYDAKGGVQEGLWAKGSSSDVTTDQFYYDPGEGRELLASAGLEASGITFDIIGIEPYGDIYLGVQSELERADIITNCEIIGPNFGGLSPLQIGDWSIALSHAGYRSARPYYPWMYILKPDALIRLCWQDIYDPELYQTMLDEYGAMTKAKTWDEMLEHCRQLTTYVQDDFGMIGGIQPPAFLALGKDFKNGVYFSESHDIQLYYLYQ